MKEKSENKNKLKKYEKPEVKFLGKVEKLTGSGGGTNSDALWTQYNPSLS
ncbi:MAG: hypothetical protein WC002_06780 [Candidatus Muiribacteriota bacterium]|jgi:hypothetical protein